MNFKYKVLHNSTYIPPSSTFEVFLFLCDHSYFSSLGDRKPVSSEDEIVVMVVPDYQMLSYVEKIASDLSDDPVLCSLWF